MRTSQLEEERERPEERGNRRYHDRHRVPPLRSEGDLQEDEKAVRASAFEDGNEGGRVPDATHTSRVLDGIQQVQHSRVRQEHLLSSSEGAVKAGARGTKTAVKWIRSGVAFESSATDRERVEQGRALGAPVLVTPSCVWGRRSQRRWGSFSPWRRATPTWEMADRGAGVVLAVGLVRNHDHRGHVVAGLGRTALAPA